MSSSILAWNATVADCGGVQVSLRDGTLELLHPLWLRERLPDPRITNLRTGERLIEAAKISLDIRVTKVMPSGCGWLIVFSDGLETILSLDDLGKMRGAAINVDLAEEKVVLWDATLPSVPGGDFSKMRTSYCASSQRGSTEWH